MDLDNIFLKPRENKKLSLFTKVSKMLKIKIHETAYKEKVVMEKHNNNSVNDLKYKRKKRKNLELFSKQRILMF